MNYRLDQSLVSNPTSCRKDKLPKKGRKYYSSQRNQGYQQENQQNLLIWNYRGSQRLKQQPRILHGTDLSPLNICHNCAAWSPHVISNTGSRGCLSHGISWASFLLMLESAVWSCICLVHIITDGVSSRVKQPYNL